MKDDLVTLDTTTPIWDRCFTVALKPDLVSGPATNTDAAIALVEKLSGVPAVNAMDRSALPALRLALKRTLPELLR